MRLAIPVIIAVSAIFFLGLPPIEVATGRTLVSGPCRPSDSMTEGHLQYLRRFSIDTSSRAVAWRAGTKVPLIADTTFNITVVSDTALCRTALVAYNAMITPDSAVTEIELLSADSVYVVSHPSILSGEFVGRHVFNHAFQYLGSYLK